MKTLHVGADLQQVPFITNSHIAVDHLQNPPPDLRAGQGKKQDTNQDQGQDQVLNTDPTLIDQGREDQLQGTDHGQDKDLYPLSIVDPEHNLVQDIQTIEGDKAHPQTEGEDPNTGYLLLPVQYKKM